MFRKQKTELPATVSKADIKRMLSTCRCGKAKDMRPAPLNVETMPEQRMRDKLARDYGFSIVSSRPDFENECFVFTTLVNADTTRDKTITFKEAAHHFGWKSFTFSENKQSIFPVHYAE